MTRCNAVFSANRSIFLQTINAIDVKKHVFYFFKKIKSLVERFRLKTFVDHSSFLISHSVLVKFSVGLYQLYSLYIFILEYIIYLDIYSLLCIAHSVLYQPSVHWLHSIKVVIVHIVLVVLQQLLLYIADSSVRYSLFRPVVIVYRSLRTTSTFRISLAAVSKRCRFYLHPLMRNIAFTDSCTRINDRRRLKYVCIQNIHTQTAVIMYTTRRVVNNYK